MPDGVLHLLEHARLDLAYALARDTELGRRILEMAPGVITLQRA
jgi:hypothetical protein